jgi:hypothetical protein
MIYKSEIKQTSEIINVSVRHDTDKCQTPNTPSIKSVGATNKQTSETRNENYQ